MGSDYKDSGVPCWPLNGSKGQNTRIEEFIDVQWVVVWEQITWSCKFLGAH